MITENVMIIDDSPVERKLIGQAIKKQKLCSPVSKELGLSEEQIS